MHVPHGLICGAVLDEATTILPSLLWQLWTQAPWFSSFSVYSTCVGTEGSLNAVEVTPELSNSQLHHWTEVYTFYWNRYIVSDVYCGYRYVC